MNTKPGKTRTFRQYRVFLARLVAGDLLLAAMVIFLAGFMVRQSYMNAQEWADMTAQSQAKVLEGTVTAVIGKSELALSAVADEARKQMTAGGLDKRAFIAFMARLQSRVPEIHDLRATDAKGIARYGPGVAPGPHIDLSDRDFFIHARNKPAATLFISRPAFDRISKKWVLPLSMRISGHDGSFFGVAYANIAVDYLITLLSSADIGKHGAVALLDKELVFIGRYPHPDSDANPTGMKYATPPLHRLIQEGRKEGTYKAVSGFDGVERTYSFRKVAAHPLYVVVGLAKKDYLSGWRKEASTASGITTLFLLTTLLSSVLLYRSWQAQERGSAALRESEERFRNLFEKVHVVSLIIDPEDGSIADANSAAETYYGWSRDQLREKNIAEINTLSREAIEKEMGAAKREERSYFLFQHRRADGSIRDVEVYSGPIQTEGKTLLYSIIHDITERRHAEEALSRSETQLRQITDNMVDMIGEFDTRAFYQFASPSYERVLGYHPEELIGTFAPGKIHPDDRDDAVSAIDVMLKSGTGLVQFRYQHKDGGYRWIESAGRNIANEAGEVIGSIMGSRDITQRKRLEESLRDTRELLAMFIRNSPIYAFIKEVTHEESRVLQASENFHQMIGIAGSDMTGKTMAELFPPEFAAKITADDWAVVSHGEVLKLDEELNGRAYTTIKFPLVQGERTLLAGYTIDITERKLAEGQLQQLANEQRIILDSIAIGVVFVKNRVLLWTNPAFNKMFGYEAAEARGLDTIKLYASNQDYERLGEEGYASIMSGRIYTMETRAIRKNGGEFWLSLTGSAVDPANIDEGSIWMLEDITERKQTETRLQDSERLFRESIEFLTIPIGIAALNGAILHYNKSFTQTYGYSLRDAPNIDYWMRTAYPDDAYREKVRNIWDADVAKAIEERGSTPIREFDVTCKDGQVKHVEIAMRPIGSIFITTFYDITDRRNAEKVLQEKTLQLEDLTRNLEQRVREEVALRKKNEDILVQQAKMAAMGEMLGAIAHQWRQPLNILGLIVQNLEDAHAYGKLDKEYLERAVQKSMAQIQHMSKTIDDFRNFYRPDKKKTSFDAMRAIGDVLALFTPQLHESGIRYRLTCHTHGTTFENHADIIPCPEKTVMGYRNEFEHAILNLVNNARESILERRERTGGPKPGFLSFDFHNRDGKIIIQVSDNGGGIGTKILDRIFEPYFTSKDPAKGTGLGLYMSKIIIEDHMGGTLDAANGELGAVFTIELEQADARRTS